MTELDQIVIGIRKVEVPDPGLLHSILTQPNDLEAQKDDEQLDPYSIPLFS